MTSSDALCCCGCGGKTNLNPRGEPNRFIHGHNRCGTSAGWKERGYWFVNLDGHKIAFHRLVMEWKIGRPLGSDEIVHHGDGDILNNNPDNLVILSRSEHQRVHACTPCRLWTVEETTRASELRKAGMTIDQIALVLARPYPTTARHLAKLTRESRSVAAVLRGC